MGFRGSFPSILAQPDRWVSWWLGAVPSGLRLIRKHRPAVIWSTYPIATAHLIGYTLHRLTGIPWVADFRDPISNADIGPNALTTRTRQWVERRTIMYAARSVFTTPGAMADYACRYTTRKKSFAVIPNGYDERDFNSLRDGQRSRPVSSPRAITLVHSGVLYPDGRNPRAFLSAIAALRAQGVESVEELYVILRASRQEAMYETMITDMGLEDIVSLQPPMPYHEALTEMASADGLLLFQGSEYNRQIPAKVYEYFRIGRPILALTDPDGDTAGLLASEGVDSIAPLDDASAIAIVLREFLEGVKSRTIAVPPPERVAHYSREAGAKQVATLFDQVVGGSPCETQ